MAKRFPNARLLSLLVAIVALAAVAVPAVAIVEAELVSEPGGPKPPGYDPAHAPLAGGRGKAQLEEVFDAEQRRLRERREKLASPEAKAERERSRSEHLGLSDADARGLVERKFAKELEGAMPSVDELTRGRQIARFVNDHTAVLASKGQDPPLLVRSPYPLRAKDTRGDRRAVDLSLARRQNGVFVPGNSVADIELPARVEEGLRVGRLRLTPAGQGSGAVSDSDRSRVLYPNVQTDTDAVIVATPTGAEIFWALRSPRAPEELVLELRLPAGAVAGEGPMGSIEVSDSGRRLASIKAPSALDAQGQEVPVSMALRGSQVVLAVPHRGGDCASPILSTP